MQQDINKSRIDILVVDDTPENLRLLSTMLSKEGYFVRKAINGQMALTAVETLCPTLILLDIMMPDLDGYEVCRRLKLMPEARDIPVIFLSALDDTFDKIRAFQAGGSDYITKPFHLEEVMARVNHQIALQLANQQIRHLNSSLEERVQERTKELEVAHARLLKLALCDSLTGLANRIAFLDHLEESLKNAKINPTQKFSVLFLDCDRFKVINDSLGHESGDELLVAIAQRLETLLHPKDVLARLGGDEFAILLTQVTNDEDITQFADKVIQAFIAPFTLQNQKIFINASLGIVISNSDYDKPEHLLRDADTAMYHAKAAGKGQYQIFESNMHESALNVLQLEIDLRKAIQAHEFELHYQPIVALNTGKIIGLEALIRWNHPMRGFISPAEFIPIAEETRLINQIGQIVLQDACQQLRTWQKQSFVDPCFSISVNLSARQFAQPDLTEQILQILRETQLDPRCLKLEITESAIMDNPANAADLLHKLRQHHIQLSMDDFGTGYSSLSYLRSFPMDYLKIDRSFVQCLTEDSDSLGLVPMIVAIAQTMNMKVIAEGIETHQHLNHLKALNCDFGQGYLFSKPLPANQIIDLIAAQTQGEIHQTSTLLINDLSKS